MNAIKIILAFNIQLLYLTLSAQTTLHTEGFETNGEGTSYATNSFDDGSNDFWVRTNTSPEPGSSNNQTYTGKTGTYFWNGEDIDATENPLGSGEDGYIVIKTLSVSSYTGGTVTVSIDIAADKNGSGGWETGDFLSVEYAEDTDIATGANSLNGLPTSANVNSGTYTTAGIFYGSGSINPNNYLSQDDDLNGTGDGVNIIDNTFTTYSFDITVGGSASLMSIRIRASTDQGGEVLAFDKISISATAGSTPVSSSITAQTNNVCNGDALGSLTVTASDGTTPYTYNWSNTATSASISTLGAGTYTVTVTDAGGGTSTSSATITEPTALNTTISSQTNVACFGENTGSLTASVTGGTSPYTYNWNSGETSATITGKAAGTYTVSVLDNNGCGEGPPP